MVNTHPTVDWSQLWYPGRKHPFSADEIARAGSEGPSPTLLAVMGINCGLIAFVVLLLSPPGQTARLTGLLVGLAVTTSSLAARLWRNPWRRPLLRSCVGLAVALILFTTLLRWRVPEASERHAVTLVLFVCGAFAPLLLWFLTVWRAAEIEARLRELAEREKSIEMARRLASAQVEPHFLFNTLASVQHWVQTRDERAGPLLASLTGYLRATLPLFKQPLLAAGDELQAIERYLEVMQARLGISRLVWRIEAEDGMRRALLPPGMLLTLVENAVGHGVEAMISGGSIALRAVRSGDEAVFEVVDNGPGLVVDWMDGEGLANIRERLALDAGPRARLTLHAAPGGGCRAEIRMPYRASLSA